MSALKQAGLLCQWQIRRQATMLPLLIVVQALLALATVIGYKFLIGNVTPEVGMYLATGASTVTLIMVGLVMTPQQVVQAKQEGSLDWMRTLPIPRGLFLVADLSVWTIIALPGMILGVLVGAWRFDVALSVAPWIPLAAILVSMTAAAVGYGFASVMKPSLALLVSQTLVFVVLLFSPVSYPASRMPEWLQSVHQWLPIEPMADLMRAGLLSEHFSMPGRSLAVLLGWCVLATGASALALRRRL